MKTRDEHWIYDARNMTLLEIAKAINDGVRLDGPVERQIKAILAMSRLHELSCTVKANLSNMHYILNEIATTDMRDTGRYERILLDEFKSDSTVFKYASRVGDMLHGFMDGSELPPIDFVKQTQKGAEQ